MAKKALCILYGVILPIIVYFMIPVIGIETPFREIIALFFIGAVPGVIIYHLWAKMDMYCAQADMYRESAFTDPLSKLYNRRGGNNAFRLELGTIFRDRKHHRSIGVCVIMIDIDKFKHINDRYGHAKGDVIIQEICRVLRTVFPRSTDICIRPGGDELSIILLRTTLETARAKAAMICQGLAKDDCFIPDETTQERVTLSIGIASDEFSYQDSEQDWTDKIAAITKQADRALYASKDKGRNRTTTIVKPPTNGRRAIISTSVNNHEVTT